MKAKQNSSPETETRFSDEELSEFKSLLDKKLSGATKELEYLQGKIVKEDEDPDFTHKKIAEMIGRHKSYIKNLEDALARIQNKTYGICADTGKLIDKARLRVIPHATLSIEAKKAYANDSVAGVVIDEIEAMGIVETTGNTLAAGPDVPKIHKCRVCGCTDNDCRQCIEKTGSPCHWVEDDLCSACVPKQEEGTQQPEPDPVQEYNQKILKQKSTINDMNFFKQLNDLVPGADISLNLKEKNGKYTMSVLPNVGTKTNIQPLIVTGTPVELDEKFFELIQVPLQQTMAMIKNAEQFNKSVEVTGKETKEPEKAKTVDKKPAAKKEIPKPAKKETKKEESKIEAPDLFAGS